MAAPKGFSTVTPFLMIEGADKFVTFLQKAFGAKQDSLMKHPNGTVWHAQVTIGDSKLMIADTMGEHPPTTTCLYIYVDDPDAAFEKAVANGAKTFAKPEKQFYGDHAGGVTDDFGNYWWLAKRVEDISDEEMQKRINEEAKKQKPKAA